MLSLLAVIVPVRIISFVLIYRNAGRDNPDCEADHTGPVLTEASPFTPSIPAAEPLVGTPYPPDNPPI
jgi:hypothetical protein